MIRLDEKGDVAKYYIDKKRAVKALKYVDKRLKSLAAVARQAENPVSMSAMKSNQAWMLTVRLPEKAKDILYALGEEGTFKSLGMLPHADAETGQPKPNTTITLPVKQAKTDVRIKYIDLRDKEAGPFTLVFDPQKEYVRSAKHTLKLTNQSWITFREMDGRLYVYTTHLQSYRNAIKEAKYSINRPTLDRAFRMLPDGDKIEGPSGAYMIEIPTVTKSVFVQLTYRDDTKSEVQEFARD